MNRIKISLLTTENENVGDDFIRQGIINILGMSRRQYDLYIINKHDDQSFTMPAGSKNHIKGNKYDNTDLCIVCGTPVFWSINGSTSYNCDWYDWFYEKVVFDKKNVRKNTLVIGAGSCQSLQDIDARSYIKDYKCVLFAQRLSKSSNIITVRDELAKKILDELKIKGMYQPCPALLCYNNEYYSKPSQNLIGINLMQNCGHYNNDNIDIWLREIRVLLKLLRREYRLEFIAHNQDDFEFMKTLKNDSENILFSNKWKDYYSYYRKLNLVISSRIHGSIIAASFGVPSITFYSDSRGLSCKGISEYIFQYNKFESSSIALKVNDILQNFIPIRQKLIMLKKATLNNYHSLIDKYIQA